MSATLHPEAPHAPAAPAAGPAPRSLVIADPGPLGLAAFALTTFVLSTFNAGLVPVSAEPVVFGLALFYGGAVQVIAGVMEHFKGNTFGATAFCSYGAFWMSFYWIVTNGEMFKDPTTKATGVGLFLLGWTIFTAYMLIVVSRVNGGLTVTFTLLLIAFICLTLGDFMGATGLTNAGGYVGIVTAFAAWYCSFAGVMNGTVGRAVVPMWPRS